ncbi:hypothetical protein D3C84_1302880 [compost metagenome]
MHLRLSEAGVTLRQRVLPLKSRLLCDSGFDLHELDGLRQDLGSLLGRLMALP